MGTKKTRHQLPLWPRLQIRARRLFNRLPLKDQQKIYVLTLVIGVLCGLAAVVFHLLLEVFQNRVIYSIAAISHWWRIPLVITIPALGGLIAGAGLYFFAPEARGSGIPQVKAAYYLENGRILARVIPAKMILSAINIGTGASLGREGPSVQICAALASTLGRLFALSRRNIQSLVPVGAAAGIAAAFNTPIAAVTFTLEEIMGDTSAKTLGSIVIASVIASVIERSFLGEHPIFNVPPYSLNQALELLFYALLGIVAGLAAVGFQTGLLRLRKYFRTQKLIPQWATPGAGGFLLGGIGLAALLSTGSASIFGVGYGQLASVLQGPLPFKVMLLLCVFKLVATVVSYSSGSAGGIFGPSLYIGGMLGGVIGLFTQSVLGAEIVHPGAFALVGMGAFFAGVVRAPVTSIIIIFEMTNNYSMILPLMIANIISYVVAYELSPTPIYDALLLQDNIHLPHNEREVLKRIFVSDALTNKFTTLSSELTLAQAFDYLQTFTDTPLTYPVLDKEARLVGLLTYNDLKRALAEGKEQHCLHQLGIRKAHAYPSQTLQAVLIKLGRNGLTLLPVVSRDDPTTLLGVITTLDIASTLARESGGDRLENN